MTFVEYIFPFQSHTPPTHPSLVLPLPILDTISSFYPHITSKPDLPHSTSPPPLLHPRRTINRPSHLRDYLCPTLPSSTALYTHFDTSSVWLILCIILFPILNFHLLIMLFYPCYHNQLTHPVILKLFTLV